MRRILALPLACGLLWLGTGMPPPIQAQVQRCETADGRTVFTDRACADVGAVDRLPRNADDARLSLHRRGCSRTLQDLTFELTMAIDARDTNRLAALYHWPGMGHRAGYAIMDRLDAIAQRPLVDARPVFPDDAPVVAAAPTIDGAQGAPTAAQADPARPPSSTELMHGRTPWRPSTLALARSGTAPTADDAPAPLPQPVAPPPRRRVPHALQVDQTLAGGSTPSRTVFGLRRHLGCWWLSF